MPTGLYTIYMGHNELSILLLVFNPIGWMSLRIINEIDDDGDGNKAIQCDDGKLVKNTFFSFS